MACQAGNEYMVSFFLEKLGIDPTLKDIFFFF